MSRDEIAEKLKIARLDVGYTQKDAAASLGKSQQTLAAWETGRSQPDVDMLALLFKLYNISPNSFFEHNEKETVLSVKEQECLKKYRTLDERGKDIVDSILDKEYEYSKIIKLPMVARSGVTEQPSMSLKTYLEKKETTAELMESTPDDTSFDDFK